MNDADLLEKMYKMQEATFEKLDKLDKEQMKMITKNSIAISKLQGEVKLILAVIPVLAATLITYISIRVI